MKLTMSPVTKGLIVSAAGGLILLQGSGFFLSSVDAQQKSAIQEELEKLYQQDGRQAPDMQVKSLPRETMDGRVFQEAPASGQLPYAAQQPGVNGPKYDPSLLSTNRLPSTPQPPRRKSMLDRLMFWKKDKPVPRQTAQPTPQPSHTAVAPRQSATATRTGSSLPPQAPPSDLPYQRPAASRPHTLAESQNLDSARQPVTLESPMNEPSRVPPPALPKWNPPAAPSQSHKTVSQPQPVRQPLISAETPPGQLPTITPKAPPAPADEDAPNRVVVTPGESFDSNQKAATLPKLDPADELDLVIPVPPQQEFVGPRPMPADETDVPLIADQPSESTNPQPAATLPNLDALPDEPLPIMPEEELPVVAQPPAVKKDFPDPFTDVSEREADSDRTDMTMPDLEMNDTPAAEVPAAEEAATPAEESTAPQLPEVPAEESAEEPGQSVSEDENPFSGLKLDTTESATPPLEIEPGAAPMLPIEVEPGDAAEELEGPAAAPALPDIDPAFDDDFKLPVKKESAGNPLPDQPILEKIPDAPLPELPAAEEGDISWEEDQARREAKLALIAAREGETGMKGFCIVELRDHRDLVDAVPAFRSTYNLRTYHFSSLAAKIEFDKSPRKYVPAYDGNDPILLSTQSEEREGSLDYALWFKGRLYLFTSQENLEIFQVDPVLYSEN